MALKIRINGLEISAEPDPYSYYTILNEYYGGELGDNIKIGMDKADGRVIKGDIYINDQRTTEQIVFVEGYTRNIIGWKQLHDLGLIKVNQDRRWVIDVPPVLILGKRDPGRDREKYLRDYLINDAKRVLASWVRKGLIEKYVSYCNSSIALGRKLNGKVKIYFDFKDLNTCSTDETSHVKLDTPKAIASTTLGKYYSVVRLYYGEWQIPLDTNTKYKTAFTFLGQQYVWNRLPGDFKNKNIILSKTLEKILDKLPQNMRKRVTFYIDTMLISADTKTECRIFTENLRSHLMDNGFEMHQTQRQICKSTVEFLGREINPDGIRLGQSYIQKVKAIMSPEHVHELRSILGLLNDARHFTPGFGVLSNSLNKLTSKNVKFAWNIELENALNRLIDQVLENRLRVPGLKDDEPCTVQIFVSDEAWLAEILNSAKKPYWSASGAFESLKKKQSIAIRELKAMKEVWNKHQLDLEGRDVEWEVESPDVARYKDNPDSLEINKNLNLKFLFTPRHKIKVLPPNVRKPPIQWPMSK